MKGYEAVWVSGVRGHTEEIVTMCGSPGAYNITIRRPDEPGLETDLQYASQVAAQRAQERAQIMQGMQNTIQGLQGPLYQLGTALGK